MQFTPTRLQVNGIEMNVVIAGVGPDVLLHGFPDSHAIWRYQIRRWWTPDDVAFVDAIQLGATGKMLKHKLRDAFAEHTLPTVLPRAMPPQWLLRAQSVAGYWRQLRQEAGQLYLEY